MGKCKIYGKCIAIFGKSFNIPGLVDRHLEIYETPTKYKAVLFRSVTKGWRLRENILNTIHIEKPVTKQDIEKIVLDLGFDVSKNRFWVDEKSVIA